jgi:hypothetical protein
MAGMPVSLSMPGTRGVGTVVPRPQPVLAGLRIAAGCETGIGDGRKMATPVGGDAGYPR